ncbi:MAG: hypothetical protein WCR67_02415 [Bacilli bacterium]
MSNLVTVIDFSSTDLRVLTGYYFKGQVYVLQALQGDILPRNEHGYLDKTACEQSLRILLDAIKKTLKTDDLGVFIPLLPPIGFQVKSGIGNTATVDPASHITQMDFSNCTNMIHKQVKTEGKKIIFDDPSVFIDDNKKQYDTFPLGSASDHLEVYADSQLIDEPCYRHYEAIVNDLKLDVYAFLLSPFCSVSFYNKFNNSKTFISVTIEKDYSIINYVSKHRLNDSIIFPFGIQQGIENACRILSIPFAHGEDLLNLFGLRDESGFGFTTDDRKTLRETSNAFKGGFEPLVQKIRSFSAEHLLPDDSQIVLDGPGSDIEDFGTYLFEELKRPNHTVDIKAIGARSKIFTSCLGAILVTSYNYLSPIVDSKRRVADPLLKTEVVRRTK